MHLREKNREEKRKQREARRKRREEGCFLKDGLGIVDPSSPVVFLFPGQGSQAVGMLNESKNIPEVKKMLDKAQTILGYDLLELCTAGRVSLSCSLPAIALAGPKSALEDTTKCQPAMFVAGLAAVEKLRQENPDLIQKCSATAGLSLGEYTALVFAGALSFEDGLKVCFASMSVCRRRIAKVVKVRAESMAEAAKQGKPHGMLSIVGLTDTDVLEICTAALKQANHPDLVCQPANYLFPQVQPCLQFSDQCFVLKGRVLSGHQGVLEIAKNIAISKGALKAQKVAVSGAFHTKLMQPAKEKLMKVASLCISLVLRCFVRSLRK